MKINIALYTTLDNTQIKIIVIIKSCDNHYYDEDDIDIGSPIQCQVMVSGVELTDEEKAEARQRAIRQYQDEELRKMQNRNKAKASQKTNTQQVELSLF